MHEMHFMFSCNLYTQYREELEAAIGVNLAKAAQNKFHVLPPKFFENLGGRAKKQHKLV